MKLWYVSRVGARDFRDTGVRLNIWDISFLVDRLLTVSFKFVQFKYRLLLSICSLLMFSTVFCDGGWNFDFLEDSEVLSG
jgi:hypothetical protein